VHLIQFSKLHQTRRFSAHILVRAGQADRTPKPRPAETDRSYWQLMTTAAP
jgi:hypothetical protein